MATADQLKTATGASLDEAGASLKLDRISKTHGHAFDEPDDSYRRRLMAVVVGAAEADAILQPSAETPVEAVPSLKTDGPTVAEYVKAGFDPANYPPQGYASKSTQDEIDAAIAAWKAEHVQSEKTGAAGAADPKLP